MRELRQIVDRWHQGDGNVLATLFRVQGSSYRQPGARLLVCKDGTYEGSISGGCLEAELVRRASWLVRNGAAVERYSTVFDVASEAPFGLGCGGVLDVLLEPLDTPEARALLAALADQLCGEERLVATWLPTSSTGVKRLVKDCQGRSLFTSPDLSEVDLLQAQRAIYDLTISEAEGVVFERLSPPQRLFIFGAGDDAKPLVTMASLLGWSITVVDGRRQLALQERFPEKHVKVSHSRKEFLQEVCAEDAVVIMTHSFEQDRECLISLLPKQPKYLGLLGSRQRSSLLIYETATQLGLSIEECCHFISAPIGLDLGGEGPESIALAIIAEAQASCSGKARSRQKLSPNRVQLYLTDLETSGNAPTECVVTPV